MTGILASLFLPDHEERIRQVEKAHKGTFQWLFEDVHVGFSNWLQRGSGIFWISGKPASGKSTLLKFAVSDPRTYEFLRQNNPQNRWVTGDFFFTNRGKQEQKTLQGLLQRILYQLLSVCDGLFPLLRRLFLQHAQVNGWHQIYLEDAFEAILKQRKYPINICLFIDALDEQTEDYVENHSTLLNYLSRVCQEADGKVVKLLLCLTSRPENIFVDKLRRFPGFAIHEYTHQDIRTYVSSRMKNYVDTRADILSDKAAMDGLNAAYGEIIRRARGVFLWVKLVVTDIIEGLRDGDTHFVLRDKVDTIPGDGDLQKLYAGILARLRPHYLHEAFLMLWLAFAAREPMPLLEFFQAFELTELGDENYSWRIPSESEMELKLISRCRGFLEVQQSFSLDEIGREYTGPFVQFLHQSVKDFLMDPQKWDGMRAQLKLKLPNARSLTDENGYAYMLRFRVWQHFQKYGRDPSFLATLTQFDLARFEVFYFAYMVESSLGRAVCEPLDALGEFANAYGFISTYLSHKGWIVPASWHTRFLALCVQAGLKLYVEYRLKAHGELNQGFGRPLLHYAIAPMPESLANKPTDPFLATKRMIKVLIRLGAEVDKPFEGATAFAEATRIFYERGTALRNSQRLVLEALLRHGANPNIKFPKATLSNAKGDYPQVRDVTPIQAAILGDDIEGAELFLKYDASIDLLEEEDWKLLKKGYIYSDTIPVDMDESNYYTAEEQAQARERLRK
jgi:hypothetical protein